MASEKKARLEVLKQEGFRLHARKSGCTEGCSQCECYRQAINWPAGVPLESNLAQLGTAILGVLKDHYSIPLASAGTYSIPRISIFT